MTIHKGATVFMSIARLAFQVPKEIIHVEPNQTHLIESVICEVQLVREPRAYPRIGIQQPLHFVRIARQDNLFEMRLLLRPRLV